MLKKKSASSFKNRESTESIVEKGNHIFFPKPNHRQIKDCQNSPVMKYEHVSSKKNIRKYTVQGHRCIYVAGIVHVSCGKKLVMTIAMVLPLAQLQSI